MKSTNLRHLLFLLTSTAALHAQSLIEQDCTIQIQSTGVKLLNWTGHVGRTYFIQSSPDLANWSWAPNIEAGENRPMSYEVDGPAKAGFFRLQYTDLTAPNLEAADFDGDGLDNLDEITQRPRPAGASLNQSLQTSSAMAVPMSTRQISRMSTRATLSESIQTNPLKADTDDDGLTDKWEEDHQLDPTDNGSNNINNGPNGDPDGDGLDNLTEYQNGTNPMNEDTNGDGVSDSDDYHSAPLVWPVIWTHNFIEAWASKSTPLFREFEPTISSGDSTPIVRWYMQKEYSYLDEQSTSFPTSYYDSWKVTYRVDPDSREVTSSGAREPREQGQEQWLDFTNGNWYLESQSHHEVTKTRVFDESIDHATLRTLGITGVQTWRNETNLSNEFTTAMLMQDLGERFNELQREKEQEPWNFGGSGISGITSFISRSEEKSQKMKCDYAMEPPSSPVSSNVRIAWLEVSAPNPYRGDIASDDDPRPPVVKLYQEFFTAARLAHFNRPFDSSQPASPKTAVHTLSPDQNQEMKVMPLACELKLYNRLGTLVANQQTGGTMAPTPDWTAHTNGSLGWSISGTLGNRPQANDSPQNTDVLWDEFNVPIRLDVVEGAENIILAARSDSGRGLDTFSPVTLPIADLREYPNGFVLQSTGPGRVVIRASLVTKHGLRIVSTTESLMGLLDLDVDSDNSGEIDGSLAEDEMEADPAQTGKLFVYTPSSGDAPGSPESWFEMSLKTSSLRASDKVQFNYDDDQMTIWNSRPDQNPPADQRVVGRGVYTLAELGIVPGTPKSFYVRPGQECGGRQLISVHIIAANANNGTSSDEVAVNLLPVEEAPEVLEVNSDFDEGRIDQATGYAIPDCDDLPGVDLKTGAGNTKLELGAERNHLDGKFTQGQQIVDDLHKGWFGVNPNQLADDFWVGANVTIRKIDKIDDDTGYKESGQVRFYAKWDGGHYGIAPYDFQTLQPVNLVAGGVNLRTNEGVYGASSTIPDGAEFYMEGVRPGKITLEWRLQKGTIDVKHEQSFKVVTQKALDAWRDELRYQIRLQSSVAGEEVDLNNFDPMDEFTSNTKFLKATYGWYQQNFVQSEDKLIWAGMAKMAGAPVYAALSDAQVARAVGPGIGVELIARQLQRALMKGNKDIFLDLAWQHRAYAASGISALKFVDDNDASLGLRSVQMTDWVTIDKGVWLDSLFKSSFGARELLRREQRFIIEAVYLEITSLGLDDIISNLAKNPIPNLPPLGKSFAEVVQGGNLAFFDDRWQWIKSDMYPGWTGITEFSLDLGVELGSGSGGYSKANRLTYSKIDLSTRARNYATFPSSVP